MVVLDNLSTRVSFTMSAGTPVYCVYNNFKFLDTWKRQPGDGYHQTSNTRTTRYR